VKTLGSPIKLSETPPVTGRPAPLLGEHTDAVLIEAGFDPADISELRAADVVR
jgi:crotonobetainyl-CoA:carnitine CoA-transferase CaiB-like acyl-CoA transferase